MHSSVGSCLCPDQGSNHNLGTSGQHSNQLSYPARAFVLFFNTGFAHRNWEGKFTLGRATSLFQGIIKEWPQFCICLGWMRSWSNSVVGVGRLMCVVPHARAGFCRFLGCLKPRQPRVESPSSDCFLAPASPVFHLHFWESERTLRRAICLPFHSLHGCPGRWRAVAAFSHGRPWSAPQPLSSLLGRHMWAPTGSYTEVGSSPYWGCFLNRWHAVISLFRLVVCVSNDTCFTDRAMRTEFLKYTKKPRVMPRNSICDSFIPSTWFVT